MSDRPRGQQLAPGAVTPPRLKAPPPPPGSVDSPAGILRAAALRVRALAENATTGPWEADGEECRVATSDGRALVYIADVLLDDDDTREEHPVAAATTAHIATWHPGVALAVADLLDAAAAAAPIDMAEPPRNPKDRAVIYAALAVARALLPTEEAQT